MKIKKIIVDEIPKSCSNCNFNMKLECGKYGKVMLMGIETTGLVPDERCLMEGEK